MPPLRRPASVVRYGRNVADRSDGEADGLQRAQCRFTARAGSLDLDLERAHAVIHRLAAGVLGGDLRRVGRRLARALEAHGAGRRPGDRVALRVGDGDHRVVEGGVDVRHAGRDVLAFALTDAGNFFAHYSDSFRGLALNRRSP